MYIAVIQSDPSEITFQSDFRVHIPIIHVAVFLRFKLKLNGTSCVVVKRREKELKEAKIDLC